jgi:hypothetical protein
MVHRLLGRWERLKPGLSSGLSSYRRILACMRP